MDDLERSLNLVDLVETEEGAADTAVETHDFVIDDSGEGKPVEEVVDLVEDRVDVGGLLTETAGALFSETKGIIDPLILVVTSQQVDLVRELDF